ncbi:MAG: NlpC/P60 family protein [Acidimicrobiia bacterium]
MKLLFAALSALVAGPLALGTFIGVLPRPDVENDAVARATNIPASLIPVYRSGAARCDGLRWTVLAAVGWHESRHAAGHLDDATGDTAPPIRGPALDGNRGFARIIDDDEPDGFAHAHGPMQFLVPTFERWAVLAPGRPAAASPSADNAWDAIHTAAVFLCNGSPALDAERRALMRYNPSAAYVDAVLAKAQEYEQAIVALHTRAPGAPGPAMPPGTRYVGDVSTAIGLAVAQVGKPYVYGATGPNAFDCSGLLVWAFAQVDVHLPRTTYLMVVLGDEVPLDEAQPGDFLFSRGDVPTRNFGHVAMAIGNGLMVVAPHTGDVVKIVAIDPVRVQAVRRVVYPE